VTQIRAKYLQHPYASEQDWIARNPLLKNGEEGYAIVVVNSITHIRKKVGPGRWNDLSYFDGVVWTDTTPVTTPIGEATGNLAGLTPIEILDRMLNPYLAPVVSNISNNAQGSFVNRSVIEIGVSYSPAINVSYSLSNQGNIAGGTPINITAGGRFNNEGFFPIGIASLTHAAFNPAALDLITISVQATHQRGLSNIGQTFIEFNPKIIHAVSQTKSLNAGVIMGLPNKQYTITRTYKRDYSFGVAGYAVLCIPTMLNIQNIVFTDITDPNRPAGYAMEDLGLMTINNGVGNYQYRVYCSQFYLLNATVLRVS
jgi:hypothetical protein